MVLICWTDRMLCKAKRRRERKICIVGSLLSHLFCPFELEQTPREFSNQTNLDHCCITL
jgi:hypothetical protein